ncbi:cytochrome P450 [Terricaulis sp.]|uniref:cytochrome P450 n=1 Tax=Terricaulis sp. TaxID=2768686 RepID=UPI0037832825
MADVVHGNSIPEIDFAAPRADDHAYLAAAAALAPVARVATGPFVSFRHRNADALFSDENTRQIETEMALLRGIATGPIFNLFKNAMLTANGEAHTRRRAPVARTFAFKLMDGMRPQIRALAEDLVAQFKDAGPIDFLNQVAQEVPSRMIARILGVPQADIATFSVWVNRTAHALGPFAPEDQADIEANMQAFSGYVAELLAERRTSPRDDFLTDYVRATSEDGLLNEDEVRTQIMGLILAGSETTRTSISATLSLLLQHPEQWRAFCADPDGLKKSVVAEGLRYDPAIGGILRVATREFEIEGHRIPQGAIVLISFLTALRDPEAYADPDRFDITRTDHPRWPLGFGAGAHRCLGEALARAELEETLAVIAREAPNTGLAGAPPKLTGLGGIRRIDRMQVALA